MVPGEKTKNVDVSYYTIQYTGWTSGSTVSWFDYDDYNRTGIEFNNGRYKTVEEAIKQIKQCIEKYDNLSVKWRYVHVRYQRIGNKEITTKEWTDYKDNNVVSAMIRAANAMRSMIESGEWYTPEEVLADLEEAIDVISAVSKDLNIQNKK